MRYHNRVGEVIKPWAVFCLIDGKQQQCMDKFALRGDAEAYAQRLRKMIKAKIEVVWNR
ncbi:MAG: hypothetical protein QNJ51_25815 [Calothrix sp. MO_167.B12]|nr:hypothetical protein [Calothrix sp. MO_167.B12]